MKRFQLAFVAAMLVSVSTVAMAQDPAPAAPQGQGQGRPNPMVAMMAGITLTPAQQAQIDSIAKKFGDERAALRQDQSMDRDARMAKSRELMTKQSDAIKALLTDEQKKAFEKNLADMAAQRQGGGQRPPQR